MNLVLVALQLVAVPAQSDATSVEPLRGSWAFKSGTMGDKAIKLPERALWRFTFGQDKKIFMRKTGEPDKLAVFVVGLGKSVKPIDLTIRGDEGEKPVSSAGIYKLEGDLLTMSLALFPTERRPPDFRPGPKVLVVTFKKESPSPADEIRPAKAPEPKANKAPDESALAGRWELLSEKNPGRGPKDRTEIEFLPKQSLLIFRRQTSTALVADLELDGKTQTRVGLILNPGGRKGMFGLVEKFDEGKSDATVCPVRFHFRGEILEMLGEVRAALGVHINLTGQWKRVPKK
jgi:uncharacterized protein (TIGR03067 family)